MTEPTLTARLLTADRGWINVPVYVSRSARKTVRLTIGGEHLSDGAIILDLKDGRPIALADSIVDAREGGHDD